MGIARIVDNVINTQERKWNCIKPGNRK